jgi:hypothetical protein
VRQITNSAPFGKTTGDLDVYQRLRSATVTSRTSEDPFGVMVTRWEFPLVTNAKRASNPLPLTSAQT